MKVINFTNYAFWADARRYIVRVFVLGEECFRGKKREKDYVEKNPQDGSFISADECLQKSVYALKSSRNSFG